MSVRVEILRCEDCGRGWTPLEYAERRHWCDPRPGATDPVTQPAHYTAGAVECIDAIRAAMPVEEFRGFCKANVLKYLWRMHAKGGVEDVDKALVYLRWLRGTYPA